MFCVCFLGRQGPPRPARRRTSENKHVFMFPTTHAHICARGPPRQVAERGANKPQTHTTRRSLYSQIARASRARSCECAPSAGSEGAARRTARREKKRQRTRADREPPQRKADFPWRPRTPRAPRRAPRASRARSVCARIARRRSRGQCPKRLAIFTRTTQTTRAKWQ